MASNIKIKIFIFISIIEIIFSLSQASETTEDPVSSFDLNLKIKIDWF
jgi:hypothetical protein